MAQKKITELQLISEVEDDLSIPGDDGIQSYRTTAAQIYAYIVSKFSTAVSGQRLKIVGTTATWAFPLDIQQTKTTTYAIAATDEIILLDGSSASFTATLPTAVGYTGKKFVLKRTDSNLDKIVTIATTSSQTIDGATTRKLATQYETLEIVSDGSNWHVLNHTYPRGWVSWTPTMSWTTNTTRTGKYRRVGDTIHINARAHTSSGPPDSVTFTFDLPTGLTVDNNKRASGGTGYYPAGKAFGADNGVANYTGTVIPISGDSNTFQVCTDGGSGPLWAHNVPHSFNTGDYIDVVIELPITNWEG